MWLALTSDLNPFEPNQKSHQKFRFASELMDLFIFILIYFLISQPH